jgi:3',5'-cyclic AMP phosphodiesterase CpdA
MKAAPEARVIWLSDLHFEADGLVLGHDPRVRLDAAVDYINANYRYPDTDLCLITGDLVDTPSAENYAGVWARLDQMQVPWFPLTGNHDSREMFLKHLPLPHGMQSGFVQYVDDLNAVRLICLDSLWEGHDAGELCTERLIWLETRLQERQDTPAIVFLHHPPMTLGLPMLDPDKLRNGEDLLSLLARYPHVKQICCGHVHRPVTGCIGDLSYTSLRSALYQAPPPVPAWNWSTFSPPAEAPELGVITVAADQITIRTEQFCDYAMGGDPAKA